MPRLRKQARKEGADAPEAESSPAEIPNIPIFASDFFDGTLGATQHERVAQVQVLSLDQAAMRAGIVRRTLERLLAVGEGPATIQISRRRVGIAEDDLNAWLSSRRRPAPGSTKVA